MRQIGIMTLLAAMAVGGGGGYSQDSLGEGLLEKLKAATVFIRTSGGQGTGFVAHVQGDWLFIVTNDHVMAPARSATVVFWPGTDKEKSAQGLLVASNPGDDLAILRVEGLRGAPAAISYSKLAAPRETLSAFIFGFPLGDLLKTGAKAPSVTVSKGTVSALRRNDSGVLVAIQISGDINPGNSGGPIVDGKGQLIGVTVAKVRGTQIGFAIPGERVTEMFDGSVVGCEMLPELFRETTLTVRIRAGVSDPFGKVSDVRFYYTPLEREKDPQAGADGVWERISNPQTLALTADKGTNLHATKLSMTHERKEKLEFWGQFSCVDSRGKTVYTAPFKFALDFNPETAMKSSVITGPKPVEPEPAPKPEPAPPPAPPAPGTEAGSHPVTPPRETGRSVVEKVISGEGIEAAQLTYSGLAFMEWSPDSRHFYLIGAQRLHKIRNDDLFEERILDIGPDVCFMTSCKAGLVLCFRRPRDQIWVVDFETLEVRRSIPAGSAERVWCTAQSSVGFLGSIDVKACVDLMSGEILGRFSDFNLRSTFREFMLKSNPNSNPPYFEGFSKGFLTADAKSLVAVGGKGELYRLWANQAGVEWSQYSQGAYDPMSWVTLSPDGRYLAVQVNDGFSAAPPNHFLAKDLDYYIYKVEDLSRPYHMVAAPGDLPLLAFDPERGVYYGSGTAGSLIAFGSDGKLIKSFKLEGIPPADKLRRALVPRGNSVLAVLSYTYRFRLNEAVGPSAAPAKGVDWLVDNTAPFDPKNAKPEASGKSLEGDAIKVDGVWVTNLEIDLKKGAPVMAWDPKGEAIYCLEVGGTLRKVAVASLKETATLEIGAAAKSLAISRSGVVVPILAQKQLWVIHPDTLKVTKRIPCESTRDSIVCSPELAVAFMDLTGPRGAELGVFDLKKGELAKTYRWADFEKFSKTVRRWDGGQAAYGFESMQVGADGKYLLIASGAYLNRMAIGGTELTWEESLGGASSKLFMHADGDSVGISRSRAQELHVFGVRNLSKPSSTVTFEAGFRPLTITRKGTGFIGWISPGKIALTDSRGKVKTTYNLGVTDDSAVYPHPDGERLLVVSRGKVVWVDPKGK